MGGKKTFSLAGWYTSAIQLKEGEESLSMEKCRERRVRGSCPSVSSFV